MSDATKQALEAFALQIINAAKTGTAWTTEQTPLLVQEWLRWQLVSASMLTFMLLIITVMVGLVCRYCWQQKKAEPCSDWEVGGIISAVITVALLMFTLLALGDVFKVLVAPRVVVFEKFIEVVK